MKKKIEKKCFVIEKKSVVLWKFVLLFYLKNQFLRSAKVVFLPLNGAAFYDALILPF